MMARGRMIDKRIARSKKFASVSDKARLLYLLILPHIDCEGRIKFDDIEDLKDECLPKLKHSLKIIADALNELSEIGLIALYPHESTVKTCFAIEYSRFSDFQVGLRKDREAPSMITQQRYSGSTPEYYGFTPALRLKKFKEGRKEGIPSTMKKKIFFNPESSQWENITEEDRGIWRDAYPTCNLDQELKGMIAWLLADWPDRKKIQWKKFITGWLARNQQKGGTKGVKKTDTEISAEREAYGKRKEKEDRERR